METTESKQIYSGLALPAIGHRWMRLGALVLVFVYICTMLPGIVWTARHMDELAEQRVPPWDDSDYQALAINLLHGYGFTESLRLPYETYESNRDVSLFNPDYVFMFYRAPGFVFLLAGLYAITGVSSLAARLMIGILIWLTAVLLLWIGDRLAGWVGSLAGGLAGYYLINISLIVKGGEGYHSGRILSEPLTAFLVTLFALLYIFYLQTKRNAMLYLACLTLAGVVLTRANFLAALPIFILLLFLSIRQWKPVLISSIILFLPLLLWSTYASITLKSPVLLTTQGNQDFPRFNNKYVLTGFGPDHINQGGWQPGFTYSPTGELIITNSNAPQAGENGWIKGLQFWLANPEKLPKLFYVKLRAGLWHTEGSIHIIGVAFFLVSLGFRNPRHPGRILPSLNSKQILALQIALILLLFIQCDIWPFWTILVLWGLMALLAIFRPYGDVQTKLNTELVWFIPLFAAYIFSTVLFGGFPRFHFPIDPLILLFGFTGVLLTTYHLLRRDLWLTLLVGILTASAYI